MYSLGPINQTAIAVPLFSLGIISAIVPPPSARGAPPKPYQISVEVQDGIRCLEKGLIQPMKNRNTINMPMLVLTAAPTVKLINKTLQVWYNGRRPYISDIGAITSIKLESRVFDKICNTYSVVQIQIQEHKRTT